ncbi:protein kinase family protein [Knoellia koreensis]|uniref:F5/8 type C domain-containing protein n=1 Tax=Knoellia koreensis TaxID=2730921 RepID=A0A849HNE1_9MICO|nr:protein kinase family protein [Knoellia sp. DB2414S]NNM48054.1 hypothetical protein [Knoellia sp. DB2414S]
MHGVGPSTVLGGRYAAQRRLEMLPNAERWSAHDTTLERDVVLVCFAETEQHADATLDAARRAAGIDNPRLVRVLDVGRSDGIAFFVEEALPDTHTVTQLLGQGGLPAEEARRIAGEVATGLEAARGRGLHHLRLTPDSVLRLPDGTIKVRGLATAAAMAHADDVDADRAARTDAVGIVALTYAALTSRWPLPTPVPGLESAPHVVGGVPAPSEIAAGVPGDLDGLCRLTLTQDQGPVSPGDFAAQIAPWALSQVQGSAVPPRTAAESAPTIALPTDQLPLRPAAPRRQPQAGVDHGVPQDDRATGAETPQSPTPATPDPTAPSPAASARTGSPTGAAAGAAAGAGAAAAAGVAGAGSADESTRPLDLRTDRTGDDTTQPMARPVPAEGEATTEGEAITEGEGTAQGAGGGIPPTSTFPKYPEGPGKGAAAASAAGAAVAGALGTAGQAAGQAAAGAAQKVGSFARAAADKAAERRAQRQEAQERAEQRRVSLEGALVESGEPLDPPLPMLPQELGDPPSREQSRLVLMIIAGFLVVATALGWWGVSQIGSNTNLGFGTPAPKNTITVTAPPTTVGGTNAPEPTATEGSPEGGDFPILSATGYDPEGDGSERNSEAARTYDGKDSTSWSSEGYASANLGGLKKGVGVRLDLGQVRSVSTVKLSLPDASDVTVSVGPDRDRSDATEIGTSSGKSGEVTLKADKPVKGQYVFVWFTKVSQVSDGRFRATLAEVTVS